MWNTQRASIGDNTILNSEAQHGIYDESNINGRRSQLISNPALQWEEERKEWYTDFESIFLKEATSVAWYENTSKQSQNDTEIVDWTNWYCLRHILFTNIRLERCLVSHVRWGKENYGVMPESWDPIISMEGKGAVYNLFATRI